MRLLVPRYFGSARGSYFSYPARLAAIGRAAAMAVASSSDIGGPRTGWPVSAATPFIASKFSVALSGRPSETDRDSIMRHYFGA